MARVRVVALLAAGVLAWGCGRSGGGSEEPASAAGAGAAESVTGEPAEGAETASSSADRPLAEFEAVSAGDVAMYLRVMRTAAQRVRDMPASDRQALRMFKAMTSGGGPAPGQIPSPEQMAAIQRAGDLMTLDAVVAREENVPKRFSSVQNRVDRFLRPMTGSSGEEHEEMTAERRAWLQERIRKFKALDEQDASLLAPHREELLALEKQVRLALHPESMPE